MKSFIILFLTTYFSFGAWVNVPQSSHQVSSITSQGHEITWDGVAGRTYFVQWSVDLQEWHFLPDVKLGADEPITCYIESSESQLFTRVIWSNWVVDDAHLGDADFDGYSNIDELIMYQTNPLQFNQEGGGNGEPPAPVNPGDGAPDGIPNFDPDAEKIEYVLIIKTVPDDPDATTKYDEVHLDHELIATQINAAGGLDFPIEIGPQSYKSVSLTLHSSIPVTRELKFMLVDHKTRNTVDTENEPAIDQTMTAAGPLTIKKGAQVSPVVDLGKGLAGTDVARVLKRPDIFAAFGYGGEQIYTPTQIYLRNTNNQFEKNPNTDDNIYLIEGKSTAQGNPKKIYAVLLGAEEWILRQGLMSPESVVIFEGHSNMGIGPCFDSLEVKALKDFMNVGNEYAAINYSYLLANGYDDLLIQIGEVAGSNVVANYEVPNYVAEEKLRYPNDGGKGVGQPFPKTGGALPNTRHMIRNGNPFLLVKSGDPAGPKPANSDMPPLKYKSFLFGSCFSGRDYIEKFTTGTLFYSTGLCGGEIIESPTEFIKSVVNGDDNDMVLQALNNTEDVYKYISR